MSNEMVDVLSSITGGNPGALRVIMEMIKANPNMQLVLKSGHWPPDLKNEHIWLKYKDDCGQDIECFIKYVGDHVASLVPPPDSTMSRQEHLQSCKAEALELVDNSELHKAVFSMTKNLHRYKDWHDGAAGDLFAPLMIIGISLADKNDVDGVRDWINGFN